MHVYVCPFACMLGREVYKERKKNKTGHPTFEWDIVFAERCQKKKKKRSNIFAVREMLPNKT